MKDLTAQLTVNISSSKNRVVRFSTGVLNLISCKYKCENQFGLLFYGTVVYVSKRSRCISFLQWPNFIVRGHETISKFSSQFVFLFTAPYLISTRVFTFVVSHGALVKFFELSGLSLYGPNYPESFQNV